MKNTISTIWNRLQHQLSKFWMKPGYFLGLFLVASVLVSGFIIYQFIITSSSTDKTPLIKPIEQAQLNVLQNKQKLHQDDSDRLLKTEIKDIFN